MVLRMSERNGLSVAARDSSPAAQDRKALKGLAAAIFEKYATLFLLVVLVVGFSFASNRFLTTQNLTNLLVVQAVISVRDVRRRSFLSSQANSISPWAT